MPKEEAPPEVRGQLEAQELPVGQVVERPVVREQLEAREPLPAEQVHRD